MSHGDQISEAPEDFVVVGKTRTSPFTAIAHKSEPFFGIQFHPEVTHTPKGKEIISRFVLNICKCKASWTMVCKYELPQEETLILLERNPSFPKKLLESES